MTISAELYEVALLIIALGFIVLVIAAVPMILQMKRTIKAAEDLAIEGKRTVEEVNLLVKKTREQVDGLEELVTDLKDVGLKVTGLADLVLDNVRSPLISIISFIFGLEEGLKRFFRKEKPGGDQDGNKEG